MLEISANFGVCVAFNAEFEDFSCLDDKFGCDLYSCRLQHASSWHNLQQLHRCVASGMYFWCWEFEMNFIYSMLILMMLIDGAGDPRLNTVRRTTSVSFTSLLVKCTGKPLAASFPRTALSVRWTLAIILCRYVYSEDFIFGADLCVSCLICLRIQYTWAQVFWIFIFNFAYSSLHFLSGTVWVEVDILQYNNESVL